MEKCEKNSSVIDLQSVTASNVKLTEVGRVKENVANGNHLDEVYDPFSNRDKTHQTSDFGALVHIFKGSFGSGILAVPRAYKNGGLIFSLLGTVLIGALCAHCVAILVKCSHVLSVRDKKPSLNFEATAETAFKTGPKGIRKYATAAKRFVTLSLFSTYYFGNTVYVVLIAQTLQQLVKNQFDVDLGIRWCILIIAVPVLILGIGRTLKFLVPVSASGILFITFGIAVTFYYALDDIQPINTRKYIAPIQEMPVFFTTIVFAMEGIGTVLPIENSMKHPDHFRGICGVLNIAMTLIVILYSVVGCVCYLKYGEETEANITLNLPHDTLSELVKLLVALSILFTYGLQFCVPTEILWNQIKHRTNSKYETSTYYVMRGLMIIGTIFIALIIPNLGPFIGLVGALCFATLGLLTPAMIELATYWEEDCGYFRICKNIFIMIFSIFITITGAYISMDEVINAYLD